MTMVTDLTIKYVSYYNYTLYDIIGHGIPGNYIYLLWRLINVNQITYCFTSRWVCGSCLFINWSDATGWKSHMRLQISILNYARTKLHKNQLFVWELLRAKSTTRQFIAHLLLWWGTRRYVWLTSVDSAGVLSSC